MKPKPVPVAELIGRSPVHNAVVKAVGYGKVPCRDVMAKLADVIQQHGQPAVDQATRDSITSAGYGPYFIHRTGHSIHEEVHGNGANIDGLETQDQRRLLAGTCFSIEPGVYMPGKFGVRSEIDMYL